MTDNLTIRAAGFEDIALIRDMAEVVFRKTYASIISPSQMEYMMNWMYSIPSLEEQMGVKGHQYFIAELEDNPCGYLSIHEDGLDAEGVELFHLEKIYIMPDFQGNGIGRELFHAALDYASSHSSGAARVELNVNRSNSAVSFYKSMGMHISRQGDFPIGDGFYMNDYIMSIDINK